MPGKKAKPIANFAAPPPGSAAAKPFSLRNTTDHLHVSTRKQYTNMGCFPTSRRLVEDATGRYESHLHGADEAEEVTSFAMLSLLTGAALLGLRPTRRVIPSTSSSARRKVFVW